MTDQPPPLHGLGRIPHDEDGPVFDAPWEAAAFALAVRLSQEGRFTWGEWAEALGAEIAAAQREGGPDRSGAYYEHWVRALERLCAEKGLADPAQVGVRQEAWRRAYLRTPHGSPVELAAAGPRAQPAPDVRWSSRRTSEAQEG